MENRLSYQKLNFFFNLSFSDDVGVIAISCNREIGIDIERHRSDIDIQQIAKRYFSPIEFTQLKSYGDYESIELFYRLWTCKEAIIKALGIGLSYPLDEIEITFDVDQIPHLAFRNPSRKAGQWQLFPLDISPGFSACLAADTQNDPLANNRMKPFQHDAIQFADYVFNLAFTKIS